MNQLANRGKLPEKMYPSRELIAASVPPPAPDPSLGRVYTLSKTMVGVTLGGPWILGYFVAQNFKVFGERRRARKSWIFTTLFSFAIMSLVLPDNIPGISVKMLDHLRLLLF